MNSNLFFGCTSNVLSQPKPVEAVKEEIFTMSDIIKCLQEKVNPEGLRLEMAGSWLWLSGKTYAITDQLKSLGFR